MKVQKCKEARILIPVLKHWEKEYNADNFGIKGDILVALQHLSEMIANIDCEVFMLIEKDDPVGFIGVTMFQSPISVDKMASEHLWYVIPAYRGWGGLRLLKVAKAWAKAQGCSHFVGNASMLASGLHDQVCELYEAMKMKKFETAYICPLGG